MLRSVALGLMALSSAVGMAGGQRATQAIIADAGQAAEQTDVSVKAAVALAYRADALKKAFLSGNKNEVQQAVSNIDLLKREYGTSDLTPLLEAMCLWAVELGEGGNTELGKHVINEIGRWAPGHPALLATDVKLRRLEGPEGFFKSLPQAIKLGSIRLNAPASRHLFIFQHLAWIKYMASIALWGVAVVLALKYRRFFRGSLGGTIAKVISNKHFVAALVGIALAAPIMLGLDPSFNALLWVLLLTPILTSAELKITVLCVLLQIIHPCFSLAEQYFGANKKYSPSIETIQTQPRLMAVNEELLNKLSPDDQQFLLGWAALQTNDWARAESIFRGLSVKPYEKSVVMNNLGVALHRQGHTKDALDAFIKAAAMGPMAFEPIANQAIIHFASLEYEIAEQKYAEARQMKAAANGHEFSSMASIMQQIVVAMPIRDTPERAAALANYYDERYAGPAIQVSGDIEVEAIIWLIWPALGAFAIGFHRNRLTSFTKWHQCKMCGEVFQITNSTDLEVCSNCYHLFILKDDARAEDRVKKIKEVDKYRHQNKLIYVLLGIFVPGSNKIFDGSTNNGFASMALNAIFIGMIFSSIGDVLFPVEIISDPPSVLKFIGILFVCIIFLQSWYNLIFHRPLGD
jgi:tetratricopeptide (TPR) repeat protein